MIETPLVGPLDVNGWDLVKAVRLATAGTATVGEWLRSPLVYRGDPAFRDELLALVDAVDARPATQRHYLHVGRAQWTRAGASVTDAADTPVPLKKVLYAIRPALVLEWMEQRAGVPPMNVGELLAEAAPAPAVVEELAALVALKARTRELGSAPVPGALRTFVVDRFARTEEALARRSPPDRDPARDVASARFLAMLRDWAP